MTVVPENFVPGLDGVVAFTTEIAEPDKDGGALRYRGVDIEDLVSQRVTFGDVWALLVDGNFGSGLPPAEPFPLPIHSGDVRVDVQAGLAMLAPIWGYAPLLDIDDATARQQLARASVMALSYVAQSARGIYQPAVPQRIIDECSTVTARFMTRWQGEPDPRHIEAIDAYWVSAAERLGAPRYEVAVAVEQAALSELRERRPDRAIETNVEFWAAVVLDFARVPANMMPAMFTCGRTAGWCAHILEQKRLGKLVRPSAIYVGPGPRSPESVDGWERVLTTA